MLNANTAGTRWQAQSAACVRSSQARHAPAMGMAMGWGWVMGLAMVKVRGWVRVMGWVMGMGLAMVFRYYFNKYPGNLAIPFNFSIYKVAFLDLSRTAIADQ